jgi:glycosyltransferase involved in cell wall biosynthesis
MLTRSLACIRSPLSDGVSSSVLEALALGIPVLGSDNGTRPAGVELWRPEDPESLLKLMAEVMRNRQHLLARMPRFSAEDNTCKLADDVEIACRRKSESKAANRDSGAAAGS